MSSMALKTHLKFAPMGYVCAWSEAPTPWVEDEPMATMISALPWRMARAVLGSVTVKRVTSSGALQRSAGCAAAAEAAAPSRSTATSVSA